MNLNKRSLLLLLLLGLLLAAVLVWYIGPEDAYDGPGNTFSVPENTHTQPENTWTNPDELTLSDVSVADFSADTPYVELYGNQPDFSEDERGNTNAFETYSELDSLGRCGVAYANICEELMPTKERGNISQVKPTGWVSVQYDNVDGKSLYNRCHLIGWQLAGEDANWKNLITGTRYMNVVGMLPFENQVADYVKQTGNHVLYRVTPVFTGDNLVADGVQMEALSVEDGGAGVCFNVFCYNAQPGIVIDYATGESHAQAGAGLPAGDEETASYVLNTGSRKFHLPDCSGVEKIKEENRQDFTGTRSEVVSQGYSPCGICKP